VQVEADGNMVSTFSGEKRLALHPRDHRAERRQTVPGQWEGLPMGDEKQQQTPVAFQVAEVKVEQRSLREYATVVEEVTVQ